MMLHEALRSSVFLILMKACSVFIFELGCQVIFLNTIEQQFIRLGSAGIQLEQWQMTDLQTIFVNSSQPRDNNKALCYTQTKYFQRILHVLKICKFANETSFDMLDVINMYEFKKLQMRVKYEGYRPLNQLETECKLNAV